MPSFHSRSPGTPTGLTEKTLKPYNPEKESAAAYQYRIRKQADALVKLGQPLGAGVLETLVEKSAFQETINDEAKGDRDTARKTLRRLFGLEILESDGTENHAIKIKVLEELLEDYGESPEVLRVMLETSEPDEFRTPQQQGRAASVEPSTPARGEMREVPSFPIHGTGADTPMVTGADAQTSFRLMMLEEKLRQSQAENAAYKLKAAAELSSPSAAQFGQMLETQNKLLEQMSSKKHSHSSTIKVEPKVQWPRLGDDNAGGRDVEEFYEKFEDICGLANNGTGMLDKEMLVALKSCLHGSRKQIYENVMKANLPEKDDQWAGMVYQSIKDRLLRFLETPLERQLRV